MFGIWVGKDTFFLVCEECVLCIENGKLTKQWHGKTKFVPEEEITITSIVEKKELQPAYFWTGECASRYSEGSK